MLGIINGIVTALGMATFLGIVWWAWSTHRAEANRQAAMLPFALPEEYQNDKNTGESNE
ncbi:cbb3-type cytochrome oxidase subunit 3 [Castellaniella defragrans]|jgi:cytochrome c oxidase cbb3-type subunit 4|uniref:Cytochrome c oxidase subunit CcoQ n=2 Tax=Castellaniella defragrans TaxID=75697 RepID=W8X327_CASD6|nr:cytochrome oxidase [Castellaniella defragrans]KAB0623069.1 CcoQ/FixQ family Cbb3-type cytochrome c oxidase assembly chaperone [Castellaniella defragrans]MBB6082808.1 cytochrome c oxidase cbb3-type subunit 4 [Castellaniella defragrans]CDM23937.1 Cytochrome c oxidase subunit CcoQ [Castellaniella defragrans 65Phen]